MNIKCIHWNDARYFSLYMNTRIRADLSFLIWLIFSSHYIQAPEKVDTHFICFSCVDGKHFLELSLS